MSQLGYSRALENMFQGCSPPQLDGTISLYPLTPADVQSSFTANSRSSAERRNNWSLSQRITHNNRDAEVIADIPSGVRWYRNPCPCEVRGGKSHEWSGELESNSSLDQQLVETL